MSANSPIDELWTLTLAMHKEACEGNWEQLMITDKYREEVLAAAINNKLLEPIDDKTLEQFHGLQNEITHLALAERDRLTENHQSSRSRIEISQHYLGYSTTSHSERNHTHTGNPTNGAK